MRCYDPELSAAFIIVFPLIIPVVAMMILLPTSLIYAGRINTFMLSNKSKGGNLSIRTATEEEHDRSLVLSAI